MGETAVDYLIRWLLYDTRHALWRRLRGVARYVRCYPERSRFVVHDALNYAAFCVCHGLDAASDGVYLPPRFEAHINQDVRPELALLHEYFGHGLYCEYAKQAKPLVDGIATPDIAAVAESVAVWIEGKLASALGLEQEFSNKYGTYRTPAQQMEEQYGQTITWFSHGFPKQYTPELIDDILLRIYGAQYRDVEVALLFGSKKPYSDIDIYIITDTPLPEITNHWLDVHVRTPAVVTQGIELLDSTTTHPLLTGTLVRGNQSYLDALLTRIAETPITPEAIAYTAHRSRMHEEEAKQCLAGSENHRLALRSAKVHDALARELAAGRKTLTYDELITRVPHG